MTTERVRDRTKANPNARGTSNGNERGNTVVRRERKQWLVDNYPSHITAVRITYADRPMPYLATCHIGTQETFYVHEEDLTSVVNTFRQVQQVHGYITEIEQIPCCLCYFCGSPLTIETVTVDRIKPGVLGGRYRTPRMDSREGVTNVRPACAKHNSQTGGALANSKKHSRAKRRARLQVVS